MAGRRLALYRHACPGYDAGARNPSDRAGENRFLKEILTDCPEYYPALFESGFRSLKEGKDEEARDFIDKGLQSLKTHFPREDLLDAYYQVCEVLEKHLRFEMATGYYNQLLDIGTNKAEVHDYLACCYAYLGNLDKAVEHQQQALELAPSNARFHCNMGWLWMIRGNLHAAKSALKRSLELNRADEIAVNNYQACTLMLKNKLKDWDAYLLRDTDHERLEELIDDESYEKVVREYNRDRIEAFKFDLVRNPRYTPGKKYDIFFTLNYIMDFICDLHPYTFFLYEDISTVSKHFVQIMYRFILKTSDIDEDILNDVYAALVEFYNFLTMRKVIPGYEELEDVMRQAKPELIKRCCSTTRYGTTTTKARRRRKRSARNYSETFISIRLDKHGSP